MFGEAKGRKVKQASGRQSESVGCRGEDAVIKQCAKERVPDRRQSSYVGPLELQATSKLSAHRHVGINSTFCSEGTDSSLYTKVPSTEA